MRFRTLCSMPQLLTFSKNRNCKPLICLSIYVYISKWNFKCDSITSHIHSHCMILNYVKPEIHSINEYIKFTFFNKLYLKYILCVGMFALLEILFLVWKLVQIAFSLKEKEKPVFMPDTLVFEYCGLERSNFKKKVQSNILFLFSTQQDLTSASQVTGKYKAKYKVLRAIRPLSTCNCNPQEEADTHHPPPLPQKNNTRFDF